MKPLSKIAICFSIVLMTVSFHLKVAAQSQASVIKAQAMEMAKALLKKDFNTFSQYMHPKLVEMAGGKDSVLNKMNRANAMVQQFNGSIKKITIGNPGKVIKYKNELQVTVPQTTEVNVMMSTAILETTLIAISMDNGKTWKFVDTSAYNVKDLKNNLPNLSPEIVVPPMKQPKLVPREE